MGPAVPAKEERLELLADLVEAPTFLEEELARNPISVGRAVLWLASCSRNCAACSSLLRRGTALVSFAQPSLTKHDRAPSHTQGTDGSDDCVGAGEGVGADGDSSRRRWLPATVLALPRRYSNSSCTQVERLIRDGNGRSSPSSHAAPLRLAVPASSDNESRSPHVAESHCSCSALLSPCLENGLGLQPATSASATTSSSTTTTTTTTTTTKRTGGGESSTLRQLSVRALPTSPVALASAVELSGPYPVSAATCRPDLSGGQSSSSSSGQASQAAQPPARLTTAMASVLPCALDGEVLAKGSVFCVAGLFAMVVAEVWTEEGRPGQQGGGKEVGHRPSIGPTDTLVVRVHGGTDLRLSQPRVWVTQEERVEDLGVAGDAGEPDSRQLPRRDREDNVAPQARSAAAPPAKAQTQAASSGRSSERSSSAPTLPYRCLDSREWVRLVGRDFGGLRDQVASAVASVGTALRGGGSRNGGFLTAPASGLLLHGPTGVGKTLLARSVAEHSGAPWFFLDCASVFRRDRGDAEQHVQDFLSKAGACWPSVVILDQVESVCRRRPEAAGITELQVLSVLLETMDRFRHPPFAGRVFFLSTCPDAAALDPSLLQRGRLEAVLQLGALDVDARAAILGIHARGMPLEVLPLPPPPLGAAAAGPTTIADNPTPKAPVYHETTGVPAREGETAIRPAKPNPQMAKAAAATTTLPQTREDFLEFVAARCHGYLGSDLERLCREAAMSHMSTTVKALSVNLPHSSATAAATAMSRTELGNTAHGIEHAGYQERGGGSTEGGGDKGCTQDDGRSSGEAGVTLRDFWAALDVVRPASLVGHSVGMWGGDVGRERGQAAASPTPLVGCDAAMAELRAFIVTPLANPSLLRDLGLRGATGALLHGPPGCGKTSVARALAEEVRGLANFLEVRCSDLVDKVVGRSERNVSDLFAAARAAAPCILFLDQVEGVAARRGYHSSTEQTFDRILSTLLIEMDGVMSESGGHVVVLAATNDIERLDPALLRPGRLDRRVRLGIPDAAARTAIFLQRLLNMPLEMEGEGEQDEGGGGEENGGVGIGQGSAGAPHGDGVALDAGAVWQGGGVGVVGASGGDGEDAAVTGDVVAAVPSGVSTLNTGAGTDGYEAGRDTFGSGGSSFGALHPGQQQQQHEQIPLSWPQQSRPQRQRRRQQWGLLDSSEAYARWLAGETEGSSAAHVAGVCREAVLAALREGMGAKAVAPRHFEVALSGR